MPEDPAFCAVTSRKLRHVTVKYVRHQSASGDDKQNKKTDRWYLNPREREHSNMSGSGKQVEKHAKCQKFQNERKIYERLEGSCIQEASCIYLYGQHNLRVVRKLLQKKEWTSRASGGTEKKCKLIILLNFVSETSLLSGRLSLKDCQRSWTTSTRDVGQFAVCCLVFSVQCLLCTCSNGGQIQVT